MKKPRTPPMVKLGEPPYDDFNRLEIIFSKVRKVTVGNRYLHWHKLVFFTPPEGLSHEDWWLGLKFHRRPQYKTIPLKDLDGKNFNYLLTDPIPLRLHEIDLEAGGLIQMPEQITNPETRDRYYVSSLIEEAIRSSQLEGAATTRKVAKEMIQTGRPPRDKSERMILNNFLTMKRIVELKKRKLTKELIFEIHRLVTEDTLDDPSTAGRFRNDNELIEVRDDIYGETYHTPPPANQLDERMNLMCDFANSVGSNSKSFVHPVILSIILHFWLAYDHPFVDGNGRTARAIFYWSMLHHNYWLCEFISISQIILQGLMKYQRAFLYTAADDNDLTYFILYHLDVIKRAVKQLHEYIGKKTAELRKLEKELRGINALNHRQRDLISHALRHPDQIYTCKSHQTSHKIVYETARTDLKDLANRGLLEATKINKVWKYRPANDLEKKLLKLS